MSNLEASARVISAILAKLLELGISDEWVEDCDLGLDDDDRRLAGACFNWLENEGLAACSNTGHSDDGAAWLGPTLTSRGFAVLGTKLVFDGTELTVAEIVETKRAVRGGYSAIGDFLGSALGGFTKSISS